MAFRNGLQALDLGLMGKMGPLRDTVPVVVLVVEETSKHVCD